MNNWIVTSILFYIQSHQKQVIIGGLIVLYLILLFMLAYGIYLCPDSSDVGWVCQGSSCADDDSSSTGTNYWGPCGKGYTGSQDSTCLTYCGNLNGVVCALRDYSCFSNSYVNDYYCENAIRQCVDPTALGLIIPSTVLLGIPTFGYLTVWWADNCWDCRRNFRTSTETNSFSPSTETNPVWQMKDIDTHSVAICSSIDPEADPKAVATDIPVVKNN